MKFVAPLGRKHTKAHRRPIPLMLFLGLNVAEGFEPLSRLSSHMLFLLGKTKSVIEAETVRYVQFVTMCLGQSVDKVY